MVNQGGGVMGQFKRGWALAKASWRVLQADKELAVFTLLSAVLTVFAAVCFIVPALVFTGIVAAAQRGLDAALEEPLAIALLFAFYLVVSFITVFFNTALVGAALVRLRGGDPQISTGFQIALRHLPSIFVYAILSATVGVALYLIEERFKVVGQIVSAIVGGVWSIVTFLVIPVMVAESRNPFAAIGRSAELLRKTWGLQIAGNLGIGGIIFLLALPGVLLPVLGGLVGGVPVALAGGAIAAIYWAALWVVASALGQIFRAAVFVYAETGNVPTQFEGWMLEGAFRPKA